jgi:predicted DNA-binding WGR domain protein
VFGPPPGATTLTGGEVAVPRFETDERFWEIERDGKRLRIRSGPLGEPGEQVTHLSHYEAEARRDFEDRIAEKLEQGFRPVLAAREPVGEVDPTLFGAVIEALDPERIVSPEGAAALQAAWAVLGDWLAARGDVRGELITIDETLGYVDGRGRDRLLARRDQLLDEWTKRWFGEFHKLDGPGHPIRLGWDHGFLAIAKIGTEPHRLDLGRFRLGLRDLVPVLEQLLGNPLMRPVRQLRIAELDPRARRDLARALPLLTTAALPALIRLELGGVSRGEWIRDEYGTPRQRIVLARIGSLAQLARAREWAPRLAALRVIGSDLRVFPPLPQLRVLELMVPNIAEELRAWLATSEWPRLERLWVRAIKLNDAWGEAQIGPSLDDIFDHLARSPLAELGLQGATALATFLTHDGISKRPLAELRLFCFGDSAVDMLLTHHERLAQVDRIVLEDGEIGRRYAELTKCFGSRLHRCQGTFAALDGSESSDVRMSIFDHPNWSG